MLDEIDTKDMVIHATSNMREVMNIETREINESHSFYEKMMELETMMAHVDIVADDYEDIKLNDVVIVVQDSTCKLLDMVEEYRLHEMSIHNKQEQTYREIVNSSIDKKMKNKEMREFENGLKNIISKHSKIFKALHSEFKTLRQAIGQSKRRLKQSKEIEGTLLSTFMEIFMLAHTYEQHFKKCFKLENKMFRNIMRDVIRGSV